jgi:adenylate cyclase
MAEGIAPRRAARRRWLIRRGYFAAVACAAVGLSLAAYATGILKPFELDAVDELFTIRGDQRAPSDVVLVKIDERTLRQLGLVVAEPTGVLRMSLFARGLLFRPFHASVIRRLRTAGARVIAYDISFTQPTTEKEDRALQESLAAARGKVVLAATEVGPQGQHAVLGGEAVLRQYGLRAGNANLRPDQNGVVYRVWYSLQGLQTFAVAAAEVFEHRKLDTRQVREGKAWIDYAGPPGTIRGVSFSDVLNGEVPASVFRGKAVVVGPVARSIPGVDVFRTPAGSHMASAEIQANAIATALRGFPLREAWAPLRVALIVLLALVVPLAAVRLTPLWTLALAGGVGLLFAAAAQLAFDRGTVLTYAYPAAALLLSTAGSVVAQAELAAREHTRTVFARFVPEEVVDEALARARGGIRLGGVECEGTVMFADIRGFTSFSEARSAPQVIDVLNRYLTEMSEAILAHGGTLVSYIGDGIMAVFGAPIEQEDHADRALAAAREMLEALPRFNSWIEEMELGEPFRIGIGLNSGAIVAGNVGSERRLEYTAIGDVVNTAARIEASTKGTGEMLFVAESTISRLSHQPVELVYFDEIAVRGRKERIKIWSLANRQRRPAATAPESNS